MVEIIINNVRTTIAGLSDLEIEGLSHVFGSYNSPFGEIVSNWKNDGNGKQLFEITIPGGSSALVRLPATGHQTISLAEKSGTDSYTPERDGKNHIQFELGPGEYTILVENSTP